MDLLSLTQVSDNYSDVLRRHNFGRAKIVGVHETGILRSVILTKF